MVKPEERLLTLAIGRLLRLLSRPYQPGDDEQYAMARSAALNAAESMGQALTDPRPNYARDRNAGAAGD